MIRVSRSTLHVWLLDLKVVNISVCCRKKPAVAIKKSKNWLRLRLLCIFCNMRGMWLSSNHHLTHFGFQHIYSVRYRTNSVKWLKYLIFQIAALKALLEDEPTRPDGNPLKLPLTQTYSNLDSNNSVWFTELSSVINMSSWTVVGAVVQAFAQRTGLTFIWRWHPPWVEDLSALCMYDGVCICLCVCVCVTETDGQRERERRVKASCLKHPQHQLCCSSSFQPPGLSFICYESDLKQEHESVDSRARKRKLVTYFYSAFSLFLLPPGKVYDIYCDLQLSKWAIVIYSYVKELLWFTMSCCDLLCQEEEGTRKK